jgi:Mn2+/Fe2+ NRAMP family transporter
MNVPPGFRAPPATLGAALREIGPGLVSSASIVGSGELITTAVLGAEVGFVALWIILLSCLGKVFTQLEFGKHAIAHGMPTLAAFNRLPGPRFGRGNWAVWMWLALMTTKFVQYGGIVGSVALMLALLVPAVPATVWALVTALSSAWLVHRGYYSTVERGAVGMMFAFTLLTLACLAFVQMTPHAITADDLLAGLTFTLPAASLGLVIAAFGTTGVSADEAIIYPYWCLEKGYAAATGPRPPVATPEWTHRARGWIRVMYLDATVSMVVYTVVTVALYLLGAAVLHGQTGKLESTAMVESLATLYTATLGDWARPVFLLGGALVLYKTLFVSVAGWARVFADAFAQAGFVRAAGGDADEARQRLLRRLTWAFPLVWAGLFLAVKLPVFMVVVGGIGTAALTLLVVFAALWFRWRDLPPELRPSRGYDAGLGVSVLLILGFSAYSLWGLLR